MEPNEKYWINKTGNDWKSEVDKRKLTMHIYELQEKAIYNYIEQSTNTQSNLKVLEFGCGYGRHLKNVNAIIETDNLYAVDISKNMSEPAKEFCKNINIVKPLEVLPFDNKFFDIIYSCNVLIHIKPNDLISIILNFTKHLKDDGVILHCETINDKTIQGTVHGGSWIHSSIIDIYKEIGFTNITNKILYETQRYKQQFLTFRREEN